MITQSPLYHTILEELCDELIVSCHEPEGSPLREPQIIAEAFETWALQ